VLLNALLVLVCWCGGPFWGRFWGGGDTHLCLVTGLGGT
jgi:hypothetical protein